MNRIVVLGGTGLLGTAVVASLHARGFQTYVPGRAMCDFTSPEALLKPFLRQLERETVIINCAAYTDVDEAESGQELQRVIQTNATALAEIAEEAVEKDMHVVHVSTDYVFGGLAKAPYAEDDPAAPLNMYGWSKLAGERILAESGCRFTIVRTSWLYGPSRPVFVNRLIDDLYTGRDVEAATDIIRVPTPVDYVAERIVDLAARGMTGFFHCMLKGISTPYEVAAAAQAILWKGGPASLIRPTQMRYVTGAPRPVDVRLDCSKMVELLGHEGIPHWREALESYALARAGSYVKSEKI